MFAAMDFSAVKLVVADMDGTLLNSEHEASERFFELFEELRARNITFVAASGRQYHSILDKLGRIDGRFVAVAENGAYVVEEGRELLSTPLPAGSHRRVLDLVDPLPGVYPVLCTKSDAFVSDDVGAFRDYMAEFYSAHASLPDLYEFQGEVLKIALYHAGGSEANIYPHVRSLEGELKVKVSGPLWVDVSDPNAHKGHAIAFLQRRLGVTPAETMVFGDYNNDLEMLALADFSYAMENAHENVRRAARYATGSNDAFGVERVLEEVLR